MLGESWIVDVELEGELNAEGMVFDFSHVKRIIKQALDESVDHKLIVPTLASNVSYEKLDEALELNFKASHGSVVTRAPESAFAMLPLDQISDLTLAGYLETMLLKLLPDNVIGLSVRLRHEAESEPFYHYTHGLKRHDGNCQRIAHGHRSRIGLWIDGEKRLDLEKRWAERWRDIYLASAEDVVSVSDLPFVDKLGADANDYFGFEYSASQGVFSLAVSKANCEIVDCDTTVECLADYIRRQLSAEFPNQSVMVKAYEGVEKGAICGSN
jgi:6-pyruvoyl-tetrahydropterin synthase